MKLIIRIFAFLVIFFAIISCRNESRENQRAYVEGKIVTTETDNSDFFLRLENDGTKIAETQMDASGNFVLSGPISDNGFNLTSTRKIKSFSANKSGLILSADFMKIAVPKGITYVKFNEIILEK